MNFNVINFPVMIIDTYYQNELIIAIFTYHPSCVHRGIEQFIFSLSPLIGHISSLSKSLRSGDLP